MIKIRESIERGKRIWDDAIKGAESDNVALELLRDKKRWLCRNDLFYLCEITGNEKVANLRTSLQPFADEVSLICWKVVQLGIYPRSEGMLRIKDVVDSPDELWMQRIYLCHRVFYKSTIVSKVNTLQLLLNFPNIRIVLLHNKQDNASAILKTVRNYFLTTQVGALFPEYIPKGKEWGNNSGFSVAAKTDFARDEDNLEAIGIGTEIIGRHWDVAKKDDIVTDDSVNTEEQIKKVHEYDDRFDLGHFADPRCKVQDYSGTRYHFADRYSKLLESPNIKKVVIPLEDGKGNPTHPDRFTREDVQAIKSEKNPWDYNCQMLLKPEDPARMQFKKEMIQYFVEIPKGCNFYLLIDPASARKKKSDYTVMLVVGVARRGNEKVKFIVDGVRDRIDPNQRIKEAVELCRKWEVKGIGWEAIGFQETDCFNFEEERRKWGLRVTVEEIKSHEAAKEDRVRGLVPEYANGEWRWPVKGAVVKNSKFDGRNYDLTEALEYELLKFPLAEHDDLMDAQTFLNRLNIVFGEVKEENPEPRGMTFGDLHQMMDDKVRAARDNPWGAFHIGSRV